MKASVERDIATVARISAVPTVLRVVSELTGLRLALVARVTPDSWTACAVRDDMAFGLRVGDELEVATTLCSQVRHTLEPVVMDHASADPVYCEHPSPKMYGFESYIAVPLVRPGGEFFGTLCALDRRPLRLREPKTVSMMTLFAELISLQIDDEEAHARGEAALAEERDEAGLREQFIAVLGHDLRTPLSSITTGAELLLGEPLPAPARAIVERVRRSAGRIERLVDDVLDFTRGRLGGGMRLDLAPVDDLEARLRHVVDEVASRRPDRPVRLEVGAVGRVVCDRPRVEQAAANLLANAFEHGPPGETVTIALRGGPAEIALSVHNGGAPVPADVLPRLFQPFYRGSAGQRRGGLGLGLFIVSEIARAHGGSVSVASTAEAGTTFTLALPRAPADLALAPPRAPADLALALLRAPADVRAAYRRRATRGASRGTL